MTSIAPTCRPPLCRFAMVRPGASTRCPWVQWTLEKLCLFVQVTGGHSVNFSNPFGESLAEPWCLLKFGDARTLEIRGLILQLVSPCFTYFHTRGCSFVAFLRSAKVELVLDLSFTAGHAGDALTSAWAVMDGQGSPIGPPMLLEVMRLGHPEVAA